MDIPSPPPPPSTTATTTTVKILDLDNRIQPEHNNTHKHLPPPFSNGVLKRHKPRHLHQPAPVVISYKECLKNHAATIGGHAVDGCGEFMPSPTSTPTDPTSLKCAACGCHRNFHRREPDETFPNNPPTQHVIEYQPHHRHHPPPPPPQPISLAGVRANSSSPPDSPSPPPISSSYYPSAPHMLLALSAGLSAPPPEHNPSIPITGVMGSNPNPNGKKRFRTKFSQDQKEKMHELAERVGWKMQKRDEDLIIKFCNEIGVDKGVFKVWMHNNKMTLGASAGGKKDSGNDNGSSGGGTDFLTNRINNHHHHHHHHQPPELQQQQQQNNDSISSGGGGNVIGGNGSSSSF